MLRGDIGFCIKNIYFLNYFCVVGFFFYLVLSQQPEGLSLLVLTGFWVGSTMGLPDCRKNVVGLTVYAFKYLVSMEISILIY
jgi:hypothetical protein